MKQINVYAQINNHKPFEICFNNLDKTLQKKIDSKLFQLQSGNFSDCSILKQSGGVKEARIRTASGLRIYFFEEETEIIILLAGGDKNTQEKDIEKATEYLQDYKQRRS